MEIKKHPEDLKVETADTTADNNAYLTNIGDNNASLT